MEDLPVEKNHLVAVGEVLFDGQPLTDEQHLMVVEKGLGNGHNDRNRHLVMDYAKANIKDANLLSAAELSVAEKAISRAVYPGGRHRGAKIDSVVENNQKSFNEAYEVASDVLSFEDPVNEETYARAFALVRKMQEKPTDWFVGKDEGAEEYSSKLISLAVDYITQAEKNYPEPAKALGTELHHTYRNQIDWANSEFSLRDAAAVELVGELAKNAMASIDADTPDAVEFCLDLRERLYFRAADTKGPFLLQKALEVTEASSREPSQHEMRSLFGFKRTIVDGPSSFENRRKALWDYTFGNFNDIFKENPDFLGGVVELFDDEESRMAVWRHYGSIITNSNFTGNHDYPRYNPGVITEVQARLDRFGQIAPSEIVEETRQAIKTQLDRSVAANKA